MQPKRPIALSIAGTDPTAGAGIQADLKTFSGLDVFGCTVITAVNAQNTQGVQHVELLDAALVQKQLDSVLSDCPPAVVKLGQLGSAQSLDVVAQALLNVNAPIVCDPVLRSTGGVALFERSGNETFCEQILPLTSILTPNISEAEELTGLSISSEQSVIQAAHILLGMGAKAILLKGGHATGALSADYWTDGQTSCWINSPRLATPHTHGGGCTLSSAIAAGLAHALAPLDAVILAKAYVNQGLLHGGGIGHGRGPLAHLGWPDRPEYMPWITPHPAHTTARLAFPPIGELGLYPIVDRAEWIARLAPLGLNLIQLRPKDLAGRERERELLRGVELSQQHNVRLIINDHWRFAIEHRTFGVHLGQDDLPDADLNAIAAAGLRLGISTHGYAEIATALAVLPSYIAIGTVYQSTSKQFTHIPIGLPTFAHLRKLIAQPVVAIGGITLERAPAVLAAGADGISVISDLTKADDISSRCALWQRLWM
ncbi:MAG: bifunctional hydroxymethylpyrimidine kinase/phosphomethylpyrimidine kinase [Kiritimatiellae bacterium]|nr:bifunctional hydroxymethylpyrimidine kinase/phosphomethylpyrimidine kinase [Kiritimatiellia bacterium]